MKYPLLLIRYRLGLLLELAFVVILVLVFFNIIDILDYPLLDKFTKLIDLKDEQLARQIVFSQVSLSFLILSLLSFLTNLKKDKILGTSIYRIIFSYSIFGNLTMLSGAVFSLLFTNILIYFNDPKSVVIPYNFLVTMILLSVYILKIIIFTNNQKKSINKISTLYYTKNIHIVKHNFIEHNKTYQTPQIIFDLIEDTERKIRKNDIEYIINFQIYSQLSNLTLRNYRKKVQENYTEKYRKKDDITTIWIRQISVLINCNLLAPAIKQYCEILIVLINNSVFLESHELNGILSRILKHFKNNSNTEEFVHLEDQLYKAMNLTVRYTYFKLNNDFSYTRLGKHNLNHMFGMNADFYKEYYQIIWESSELSKTNKRRMTYELIENIRMFSYEIDSPFHYNFHSINSHYYSIWEKERENLDGDLELVGIPLGLLLHEAILRKDYVTIYQLLFDFNMNSIYYSCLTVIPRLISQYLNSSKDNKYLKEVIKILLIKLEDWDSYKLKINKNKVIQNETKDKLYSTFFFHISDIKSLNIVYQSIQMKKHNVDIKSVNNKNLKKIYRIVINDSENASLKHRWSENQQEIIELYHPKIPE